VTAVVAFPWGSKVLTETWWPEMPPVWLMFRAAAFKPCRKARPDEPLGPLTAAMERTLKGTELEGVVEFELEAPLPHAVTISAATTAMR
jgi:hypothetical protein